ncbi:MAG: polysaccharide deacetylase family protein [Dehalococcoidia bacterium]|nr:polysaccharide deacetylase family protein [Dehalococcoidia bacterium]
MRRGVSWYVTGNLAVIVVVLGVFFFWQAAEAPRRVESETEIPAIESPEPQVQVLSEQTKETTVAVTTTAGTNKVLASPPVTASNQLTVRVPILMYHRIDRLPPDADASRTSLSIIPTDFDTQIRFLKDRGFTSLSLADVYDALQGKRTLPAKPVVLTFDDGYADNYANAFPILKRYSFLGTFFVLTDVTGTGEYMNWDQLKEMSLAGMKIEVHGRTHSDVTRMTAAQVINQLKGAREALQARLGLDARFYAYPSGRYNDEVIDIVKANGFLAAVTVNYGTEQTLQKAFELKRVRIDGRDGFSVFARKLGEIP